VEPGGQPPIPKPFPPPNLTGHTRPASTTTRSVGRLDAPPAMR
jgi:hypothetical protein